MPIRIAFIDDNLDNFHANTYLKMMRSSAFQDRGVVIGCHALQADAGRAWSQAQNLPWYDDAMALMRDSDVAMILAPSTPETHMELCRRVFPAGKPTYVDKTFAQDFQNAEDIFALADRHCVPVQTSSALRYTAVQRALAERNDGAVLRHVSAWGGGRSFGEYGIHPLELVISILGPDVERLMRLDDGDLSSQLLIGFSGNRSATVNFCKNDTPFIANVTTNVDTRSYQVDMSQLFWDALAGILSFLESGRPHVDRRESLMIRKVLDLAETPECRRGFISMISAVK